MCRFWDISLICAVWEGGKNCYGHKMVHLVTPDMYSVLLLVFLKLCVLNSFHSVRFSTGERLSTPFWCFEAPASSSHPPARNPLCTHRTGKASSAQEKGLLNWNPVTNSQDLNFSPRAELARQRTAASIPVRKKQIIKSSEKRPCSQEKISDIFTILKEHQSTAGQLH